MKTYRQYQPRYQAHRIKHAMYPRHIVSFSTGIPSAAVAYLVCQQHPDAIVLFADVLVEDEDNYRFLRDVEIFIGKPITTITGGLTPLEIADREAAAYIPNQRTATCTRKGKIQIIRAFMRTGDHLYIGMTHQDAANNRNLQAPIENWSKMGVTVHYPLIEQNIEPHSLAKELGLIPPRMYALGYKHANCGGCCVKQGRGDWLRTLQHFPERYAQYEHWEADKRAIQAEQGSKQYSFVRHVENGNNIGISLTALRQEQEARETSNINFFDMVDELNGYGCTVECGIGNAQELEQAFEEVA